MTGSGSMWGDVSILDDRNGLCENLNVTGCKADYNRGLYRAWGQDMCIRLFRECLRETKRKYPHESRGYNKKQSKERA